MLFRACICVFLAMMTLAAEELPELIIDPNLAATWNFPLWKEKVLPKLVAISSKREIPKTLNINSNILEFPTAPRDQNNIGDGSYRTLTHIIAHHLISEASYISINEGLAEAMTNFVYWQLYAEDPKIYPETYLFGVDAQNNEHPQAAAGSFHFYYQPTTAYGLSAGYLELLLQTANDFAALKALDDYGRAIFPRNPTFLENAFVIEQALGNRQVNGMRISTWLSHILGNYLNGPNGDFFGIYIPITSINSSMISINNFRREKGVVTRKTTKVSWKVFDAFGAKLFESADDLDDVFHNLPNLSYVSNWRTWPDGAYKVVACNSNNLCDTSFFGLYRRDADWDKGNLIVITNGPRWEDLSARTDLVIPAEFNVERLPGLLVIKKPTKDVSVKDGQNTLVFSRHASITPVFMLTRRDAPIITAVTNAASFLPETNIVPGSILTLFAFGATHNDPEIPQTTPLPTASCHGARGITRVIFTGEDGREYPAPFFYCSIFQLNIQVPTELKSGTTAKIRVELNGSRSDPAEVNVADVNPSVFMLDPGTKLGAVLVATGPNAGTVLKPDNPVRAGDYLSVYATGLGSTYPVLPGDGEPTPPPPPPAAESQTGKTADADIWFYRTVQAVGAQTPTATWPVTFSGLAPGFVGLYQINLQVPAGTPSGTYVLKLVQGGKTSNEVNIFVK